MEVVQPGSSEGGTVGPGTINEIAYFDATNTIASLAVATYPSLTELSYVKGVTSSIQTQLDAASSPWQTTSNVANLATSTDNVTIGSATNLAKLGVDGDADEVQFYAKGHSTQTSNIVEFHSQETNTPSFTWDNAGIAIFDSFANGDVFVVSKNGTNLFDVTGAGDIAISGETLSIASGSQFQAMIGGSKAGADFLSVGLGTSFVTPVSNGITAASNQDIYLYTQGTGTLTIGGSTTSETTNVVDIGLETHWRTGLDVGIGTTSPGGTFMVDGSSDQIQLLIQGNSTQTSDLVVFEQSDGTDVFTLANDGELDLGTDKIKIATASSTPSMQFNGTGFKIEQAGAGATAKFYHNTSLLVTWGTSTVTFAPNLSTSGTFSATGGITSSGSSGKVEAQGELLVLDGIRWAQHAGSYTPNSYFNFKNLREYTTIDADASTSTTIQIPAGAVVLGVSVRVGVAIPDATSFDVGVFGDLTRYGAALSPSQNTTNSGEAVPALHTSAESIVLTMNGTPPAATTGRVRVDIYYYSITPPTVNG